MPAPYGPDFVQALPAKAITLTSSSIHVIVFDNIISVGNKTLKERTLAKPNKADLIMHPVRIQILQALTHGPLTTQQISDRLTDTPTSSIYRHLKILLKNKLIEVAETRQVKAIEEKVYRLSQSAHLDPGDMAELTADQHLRYFIAYIATLLQEFSSYLNATEDVDLLTDRAGYTQVTFYATRKEFDVVTKAINEALVPMIKNEAGGRRELHKLAVVTYPLKEGKESHNATE